MMGAEHPLGVFLSMERGELTGRYRGWCLFIDGYQFGEVNLEGSDRLIMNFVDPHTGQFLRTVIEQDIRVIPRGSLG